MLRRGSDGSAEVHRPLAPYPAREPIIQTAYKAYIWKETTLKTSTHACDGILATIHSTVLEKMAFGNVAEILLTRISQDYYPAGGSCIDQAGRAMVSIRVEGTEGDSQDVWRPHAQ